MSASKRSGRQLEHTQVRAQQEAAMHKGPRVVAVGLQRPDNIGMLFRIADAVGVQELVFVDSPHITGRKVRRVSRHTQDAIPHRQLSSAEFLAHAARYEPLIALEITTHSQDLYTTDLPHDLTLVVGNERHGIPAAILAVCQRAVHIPMLGQNSSMNVATAAGIALYEWHRRYRLTE